MGEFFAIATGVFYALNTMFAQRGMRNASPSTAMMIDMSVNLLIYIIYLLITRSLIFTNLSLYGIFCSVCAGISGAWLGRTLILKAVQRISSARAISLSLTQILFSFLLARIILYEVISLISMIGIILVAMSVFWLTQERSGTSVEHATTLDSSLIELKKYRLLGIILAVAAGLAFGASDLFRRIGVISVNSPVMVAALGGIATVILQAIVVTYQGTWHRIRHIDHVSLKNLLLSGVSGGLAIIFVTNALRYSPVVIVSSLTCIKAWFAIAFSPLLLGQSEKITLSLVSSTLLIMIGTIIILLS
ncbi:MAG: EamA family transporter [Dehalobacterium sp.]